MKKLLAAIAALMLLLTCLVTPASLAEEKISVVTTIFPIYDWVREVAGDQLSNIDMTLLLDNGVDLHSYQPTAQDILKISTADLFIYVGGESDEWVETVLATAMNPDMRTINLVEAMGDDIKAEEIVEGMEHEHKEEDEHEHEHGEEADEHVWLSLRNAQKLVQVIANALGAINTANAGIYQANAAAYIEKLAALDAEYQAAVDRAAFKTVLFGDRFPFRYLVDDYGLSYYAAFSGCSAESEASFQTIVFLAQKVDELGLPAVLT
ncbi:MAG: zinc ABC transporter substrate-binding protein, partial [Clostridia bacterium]|nr:zinc ABC transporter substrate-binding protein [Clostridia bacterium]